MSANGGIEGRPAGGAPATPFTPGTRTRVIIRTPGGLTERHEIDGLAAALAEPDTRAWIDLVAPGEQAVEAAAAELGLHPLVAEDIVERNQRSKIEQVDDHLHLVLFGLLFAGQPIATEIDIVLGRRFLLTVHDPDWDPTALPALRLGPGHLLERGPDFLLHAIVDGIVDAYFPVLDRIDDDIDGLQDAVIERPTAWTLQRLFALKRELITLRRAVAPAREILNQLTNRDLDVIAPEHVIYFRDVYDHLIRVTDELDTNRELVAGTLEVYLSQVNNNLSAIMKRLTGVTVVLAGIGALAGLFGMSEAGLALAGGEAAGFWVVTAAIVAIALGTAIVLRRIDWI